MLDKKGKTTASGKEETRAMMCPGGRFLHGRESCAIPISCLVTLRGKNSTRIISPYIVPFIYEQSRAQRSSLSAPEG